MKEKNQRSVKNLWISRRRQLKMALHQVYVLHLTVLAVAVLNIFCFSDGKLGQEFVSSQVLGYLISLLIVLILSSMGSLFISLKYSNRFVGPLSPIGRHIDELIAGNFGFKSKVRADDETEEVVFKLNKLSEKLKERGLQK